MRIREAWRRMGEGGELAAFYRAFGLEISAGLPFHRALAPFAGGTAAAPVRERARALQRAASRGKTLADGTGDGAPPFWPLERVLLELGEEKGRLEEAAGLLQQFFEADHRVALAIRSRAVQPLFLGMAASLILPLPLLVYSGLVVYVGAAGLGLGTLLLFGGSLALACFEAEREKPRWAMARLCRSLATAFEVGLSTDRALRVAAEVVAPAPLAAALEAVPDAMRHGAPLSEVLRSTGRAPAPVLATLENAERTGEMNETLRHLARLYESGAMDSALGS